ncbi:MAG: hypothetical protein ACOX01_05645 [Methanobrevibacter boviskoreani]|jgi:uncharacterized FlgJ-related protein|uniref:hypothetical protein n=1 Tax=Methanobrevibacter TaxID=2172 RepID=UPI0003348356|nr:MULTISPECIES: hypothetical protein [Methanobrevibacter]AGN16780.1 hypothetical protein Abm4_0893 [Methanobrevibacter sp. AbM4]MCI6931405.1 hypothetical protein [Methanobrevibacter boviskoreani]MDD6257368.1 hypothetical protein [Methanobrevibacter boviskoreani]
MNPEDDLYNEFEKYMSSDYPEIELETDDLKLVITLKKDYSKIDDLKQRKREFFKDLENFIEEFRETPESTDLLAYYDFENFEKSLKDD